MSAEKLRLALHERIDGDLLIGAAGDDSDLPIDKCGAADVVRWAAAAVEEYLRRQEFDTDALMRERDDWRTNAEFAGEKLQESVQRFAQASAAQLQAQVELHELSDRVAKLQRKYEGHRYGGGYGSKTPRMSEVADDLAAVIRGAR